MIYDFTEPDIKILAQPVLILGGNSVLSLDEINMLPLNVKSIQTIVGFKDANTIKKYQVSEKIVAMTVCVLCGDDEKGTSFTMDYPMLGDSSENRSDSFQGLQIKFQKKKNSDIEFVLSIQQKDLESESLVSNYLQKMLTNSFQLRFELRSVAMSDLINFIYYKKLPLVLLITAQEKLSHAVNALIHSIKKPEVFNVTQNEINKAKTEIETVEVIFKKFSDILESMSQTIKTMYTAVKTYSELVKAYINQVESSKSPITTHLIGEKTHSKLKNKVKNIRQIIFKCFMELASDVIDEINKNTPLNKLEELKSFNKTIYDFEKTGQCEYTMGSLIQRLLYNLITKKESVCLKTLVFKLNEKTGKLKIVNNANVDSTKTWDVSKFILTDRDTN
ncbi:hypothetical protein CDIK_3022 [Cucumispora dikerogammari]|nr:hypothetical protein CDIK_3022 [Cucumispora dikerogammari]